MKTYSAYTTPDEVIRQAVNEQCPDGYPMKIVDPDEWAAIAKAVNQGIDGHLEAITERSTFDNGYALVHPDELHVLLRRLVDTDGDDLRSCILYALGIEEV